MDLQGKVCVVTGASSGIGKHTALDLAKDGAIVCLVARREEKLAEVLAELPGQGHTLFVCDVSERAQVAKLAEHVRTNYGRLDVLINNAGFSRGRDFRGRDSVEDVEMMMATNFLGAVYCSAELLDLLEASRPSQIVNVASIAGRLAFGNASGYCASKFALVGWTEGAAYDLEPRGVRLSLVEPGPIPTDGFSQEALVEHPILKYSLGSAKDVSAAIRDVITGDKRERIVPRGYWLAQFPRLVTPWLHRAVVRKMVTKRVPKEQRS